MIHDSFNQSVQPTGGSRFAQSVFGRHRRLPPVADAWRWVTEAKTSIRVGGQKLCYENA